MQIVDQMNEMKYAYALTMWDSLTHIADRVQRSSVICRSAYDREKASRGSRLAIAYEKRHRLVHPPVQAVRRSPRNGIR